MAVKFTQISYGESSTGVGLFALGEDGLIYHIKQHQKSKQENGVETISYFCEAIALNPFTPDIPYKTIKNEMDEIPF